MPPRLAPAGHGETYAIRREDGLIKLGYTTDMRNRFPGIKYSVKMDVEHVYSIFGEPRQAQRIEKIAHRLAADRRVEGEWFRLSEAEAIDILTRSANIYIDAGEEVIFPTKTREPFRPRPKPFAYRCVLTEEVDRRLSAWRGRQDKIPSAPAAIVTLLTLALDAVELSSLTPGTRAGDKGSSGASTKRVGAKQRWSAPTVT